MEQKQSGFGNIEFPFTRFWKALYKMTPEQRDKADPVKAAEKYGLPVEQTKWWIEHYRRHQ